MALAVVILLVMGMQGCLFTKQRAPLPSFTILYTGDTYNYLEPCGCCRYQIGGLLRRATVIRERRRQGKEVIVLDAGNRVDYYLSNQTKELERKKIVITHEALKRMGYDVANIGRSDLFLPEELSTMRRDRTGSLEYISSTMTFKDESPKPYVIKKVGDGFVAVTGVTDAPGIQGSYKCADPYKTLKKQVKEMTRRASFIVLLSMLPQEENRRIARDIPGISVIIGDEGKRVLKEGRTLILPTGTRGENVGEVEVTFDRVKNCYDLRPTMILLDGKIKEDSELKRELDRLYKKHLGIAVESEGDVKKGMTPQECGLCHRKELEHYKTTKHSIAFDDLVNKGRAVHQGCVPCHSIVARGAGSILATKIYRSQLNVQCVVCHKAGNRHFLKAKEISEKTCLRCHDKEHSKDFEFSKYRKKIMCTKGTSDRK